jgi:HAD superfamily hydrolase (TIGR01509 family)
MGEGTGMKQNSNPMRAIIFDLGRVLVQVDLKGGLFRYYMRDHLATDEETITHIFKDELFIAFTTGKIRPLQMHRSLQIKYRLNISFEKFVEEWCSILTPQEGMEELVAQLAAHYVLGLLSDTDPLHWQYCQQHFSFLRHFTKPTLSYQTGLLKPDPRCYQQAAENAGTAIKSCLFIDDREQNVEGARRVGMQALLFTGLESLRHELKNLQLI